MTLLAPDGRLGEFTALVASLRNAGASAAELVDGARDAFAGLLTPGVVPDALLDADRTTVARHLVHRSPAVTVFVIASPPGFVSDVHDHGTWGFVGQVAGEEVETVYRADGPGPDGLVGLEPVARRRLRAGQVVAICPPEGDFHRVATLGRSPSVTLHAFADDVVHRGFATFEPRRYAPRIYTGTYDNEEDP